MLLIFSKSLLMLRKSSILLPASLLLGAIGFTTVSGTIAPDSVAESVDAAMSPQAYADSLFDVAVEIIKKYEGMHSARHWPYIGYGHGVKAGEPYKRGTVLTEAQADALLRKDLKQFVSLYKSYGADSLLLGVLAYNIGPGNVNKSKVIKLLDGDESSLRTSYVSHCRYKGKENAQLKRRRQEEFDTLFPLLRAGALEEQMRAEMDSMQRIMASDTTSPINTPQADFAIHTAVPDSLTSPEII